MHRLQKPDSTASLLIYLGVLSAFGPFVMDMYLSAFPSMAGFFHATSSQVQLSLTASTIGMAAGQLLFGALSDRYGRRTPLLISLSLFMAATVGCLASTGIGTFVAFRFVQGLAAAGGIVLSRSIAADRYTSRQLARMLATIGAINGVATILSPVGGGLLLESGGGWHSVFWFLLVLGGLLLGGTLRLRESLPPARRSQAGLRSTAGSFAGVLRNRSYLCYILQYGFAMGILFVNLASAPFIMQQHYALPPSHFSLCFAVNALGMAVTSGMAGRFPTQEQALRVSGGGLMAVSLLLCIALETGCGFWLYEALIFVLCALVGIAFTASNALAMESERRHAGVASALLGAIGYLFGGMVSPLVGVGDILSTTPVLFLAGSVGFACCPLLLTRHIGLRGWIKA